MFNYIYNLKEQFKYYNVALVLFRFVFTGFLQKIFAELNHCALNQKLTVKKRDIFFSDDEEEEDDEGNEASEKKDKGSSQANMRSNTR